MPDGGDDRYLGRKDRAGNALVVERPEILDGAAAAAGDDKIGHIPPVRVPDRTGDLRGGFRSLHAHRHHKDLCERPAPAENTDHILYSSAGPGGDERDLLRHGGKRFFVLLRRVIPKVLHRPGDKTVREQIAIRQKKSTHKSECFLVGLAGLEPTTSRV